jgi:hypothetical protein
MGTDLVYLNYWKRKELTANSLPRFTVVNYWQSDQLNEVEQIILEQIEHNFRYDDIPIAERVHIVEIPRNQDDIERLHQRVIDCRAWMEENFLP